MHKLRNFLKKYGIILLLALYEALACAAAASLMDHKEWGDSPLISLLLAWVLLAPVVAAGYFISKKQPEQEDTLWKSFWKPVYRVLGIVLLLVTVASIAMLFIRG